MSQSNVVIPPDVASLIDERRAIMDQYNAAEQQAARVHQLSPRIRKDVAAEPVQPLTSENLPPTELAVALPQLENELAHIQQTEQMIQRNHAEIDGIKAAAKRTAIMMILGIIMLIIVLGAVVFMMLGR